MAETRRFDAARPLFQNVVDSFRPLTPDERSNIREKRLRLVKAHEGETLEALTARSHSAFKANQIAVANGLKGSETLHEGQLIKIAVEEPYLGKKQQ
jgi:predicted Zn-dependent protease